MAILNVNKRSRRHKPIQVINLPAWDEIGRGETVVDAKSETYTFATGQCIHYLNESQFTRKRGRRTTYICSALLLRRRNRTCFSWTLTWFPLSSLSLSRVCLIEAPRKNGGNFAGLGIYNGFVSIITIMPLLLPRINRRTIEVNTKWSDALRCSCSQEAQTRGLSFACDSDQKKKFCLPKKWMT